MTEKHRLLHTKMLLWKNYITITLAKIVLPLCIFINLENEESIFVYSMIRTKILNLQWNNAIFSISAGHNT